MISRRLQAHGQALVLLGRCPRCAEVLTHSALFKGESCSRCDTALVEFNFDADSVSVSLGRKGTLHLTCVCIAVAIGHFIVGWFPLLSSLLAIAAAVWIRFAILYPLTGGMSPKRRMLTRWTARLLYGSFLAFSLIASEALTLIPLFGQLAKSLLGVLQVAGGAMIVTSYVRWQLRRAAAGAEPEGWEWSLLGFVALTMLVGVGAFVFTLLWVIRKIAETSDWINSFGEFL